MTEYTGPEFNTNQTKDVFYKQIVEKYDNVTGIQGRFPEEFSMEYADDLGLVHWDTDSVTKHDDIKREIHEAWNLLSFGGILSGHTFAYWNPNVVNVIREFGIDMNVDIILPPSGSIWYTVKG